MNTTRTVLSKQAGHAADADGPARTAAIISRFHSPGNIFVTWDGSGYSGAQGHSNRVSVCAGTSCAATDSTLEVVTVHKIVGSFNTDSTLTSTPLSADSSWTGVQTVDKVGLFARGGVLRTSLNVATTHSGTAQYLIAGLAPGIYSVSVGGSAVAGSPFTVRDNDNSLYFESVAGAISITRGTSLACSITTISLPHGLVGQAYLQTPETANCVAPVTWSLSTGALCAELSLNASSGAISGTPTTPQTCGFTLQVTDSIASSGTQALSITVDAVSAPAGGAAVSAGVAKSGGVRR